jgi:acyl-CoA thioesterase FadM
MIVTFLLCTGLEQCASFQPSSLRNKYKVDNRETVVAAKGFFDSNSSGHTPASRSNVLIAASASDTANECETKGNAQADGNNQEEATLLPRDKLSFASQPMQLYIEDTDAYGVMYNGNYIKSYERALHEFHIQAKQVNWNEQNSPTSFSLSVLLDRSDFILSHCTSHKFKSSPSLGSEYVIKGTMKQSTDGVDSDDVQEETWSLEMVEYVDSEMDRNDKCPKIYNTATVTISTPTKPSPYMSPFVADKAPMLTKAFTIHRDEFDVHMPGAIPLTTALNLFERVRSDALGGPDKLRQMQEDDNIIWVVTSVDDLQIDARNSIRPGDNVLVSMYCTMKRNGMLVVCNQELRTTPINDDEDTIVLAKGTVTICAIDTIRGRPTSKIPDEVRALL